MRRETALSTGRIRGRIDQVGYHGRFAQVFGTLRQILPRKDISKENIDNTTSSLTSQPGCPDGSAYAHPDTSDVQPESSRGQITLRHAEFELEVLTQHLDERG